MNVVSNNFILFVVDVGVGAVTTVNTVTAAAAVTIPFFSLLLHSFFSFIFSHVYVIF